MNVGRLALAAFLMSSTTALAQTQQVTFAPVATSNVLRAGTAVTLRTAEPLTTNGKNLKVGYRFNLETAEAVTVNGQVVIPVGTRAIGEVTTVRNKGMWGKSGGINARVLSLRVGDRTIRLSGTLDDKGKTGTGGVVASVVLIPLAGFFVTGTSANIPAGTFANAFTEEDVQLAFAAPVAPETVMVVPAAPAVAPTPAIGPVITAPAAPSSTLAVIKASTTASAIDIKH